MPATLRCPRCDARLGLDEPYPAPDSRLPCPACGGLITVRYPDAVRARVLTRRLAARPEDAAVRPLSPPAGARDAPTRVASAPPPTFDPATARPPERDPDAPPAFERATTSPVRPTAAPPDAFDPATTARPPGPPAARSGRMRRAGIAVLVLGLVGVIGAGAGWAWLRATYGQDLPDLTALDTYQPAGVTRVLDRHGTLLGELYEQRRYVLAFDDIPPRVRDAFVAAEDAAFWTHDGLDYAGILRAAARNAAAGRWAQGGSTITQQVAKNFLVGNERALARKIREAFVAWRIEEALDKERILHLYLNEIYLGSQAYGVEAAARTFFGKSVGELSLGEAAMLAGLPPRPSEWNPHSDYDAARRRQRYVLDRLVATGKVTPAEADAAWAAPPEIVARRNTFREIAPWCTEAVRRQLVDAFAGREDILRRGVTVHTTCDLDLQRAAQRAVTDGVADIDQRMGWRRDGLETLSSDAAIDARIAAHEAAMVEAAARQTPPGRPAPTDSPLAAGDVVEGVVTEVHPTWARVRIGRHAGIVPLAWSTWVYPPNPSRNWKYRAQDDLTMPVDDDGDRTPDGGILRRGDIVPVKVVATSTGGSDVADAFRGTPGASDPTLAALRLWPVPEVEAALLTFDLDSGAIRAVIGGADFDRSQLNRAMQARRQVGSTIKPLVYTAAISTRKMTAASLVADAPLAYGSGEDLWKPGNYGDDYKGNLTLREALALSRNTCTVRVMDAVDPGMGRGVVYDMARRLGLGGPPPHQMPDPPPAPSPENDWLCPWVPKESAGWCPTAWTAPDGAVMCRVCDLSIALGSTSLTVLELARAYAILGRGGTWVDPYLLERVEGPDGAVLYAHTPPEPAQVIDPALATIGTWLLQNVVDHGTGIAARVALKVPIAGKTGTTNDEKDAWFVGFTPEVATAVWVGFDQPRPLGVGSTGGHTALPIWIDMMREVVDIGDGPAFPSHRDVVWAGIDETTGRQVTDGGVKYPFLKDTVPEATGVAADQASLEDLAMEL